MTDALEQSGSKMERRKRHSIPTFIVFLVISSAAWLVVKLSEDYNTQAVFHVKFEDVPADQWISSPDQSVKMSLMVDGFHVLRYKMIRETNRIVVVSLNGMPYRAESRNMYSFSSQYVADKVAEMLDINTSDITIKEEKVYFSMDALKSKVVPVVLQSDIKTQRQYGLYGIPVLEPASVTIFGPQEIIDSVKSVKTEVIVKTNVNQGFCETIPLDLLGGKIQSNVKEVKATIDVEKYTEMDIKVPIRVADSLNVRFFPEAISVRCMVAIKDYPSVTAESFAATVDMHQLRSMQPLLDVRLTETPQTIQLLNTRPDKVEYLIVQ